MKPFIWSLLLLLSCLSMVPAEAAPVAAHIVTIRGPTDRSYIEHAKSRRPLTYWASLQTGDKLVVAENTFVAVHYTDGRPDVEIHGGRTPYIVGKASGVAGRTDNFLHTSIEDLMKRPWQNPRSTVTRQPGQTEAPLTLNVPGLTDGHALILAGDRLPVFQWYGGKAPFHVVVARQGEAPLIDMQDVYADKGGQDHQLLITSHPVRFTPGAYDLTITDASGASVHGSFQAVTDGIPSADLSDIKDPIVASLIAGAHLAQTRDPRFALEALFRLSAALDQEWGAADAVASAITKH